MARPTACRSWTAALFLASLCALLAGAGTARAQSTLDLTWTAPAGCPDRAWVLAGVTHLVTTAPPDTLRVTAVAHEEGDRWVVDLGMEGTTSGTRRLQAASCLSVARATALIVALALDPHASTLAAGELGPPEPPPPPPDREREAQAAVAQPVAPAPRREEEPAHATDASLSTAPRVLAFAGASVERALLPGVVPGVVVGGGVVWRALRIDLAAGLAPRVSLSLASTPGAGADLTLAELGLRACAGRVLSWMAAHGCASVRGARLSGEGRGVTEAYRETAYVLSLEPGVLLRVPARSRLAVELDVGAMLPLTRPDFVIVSGTSSEPLFRVSTFGVRAALAASFRF